MMSTSYAKAVNYTINPEPRVSIPKPVNYTINPEPRISIPKPVNYTINPGLNVTTPGLGSMVAKPVLGVGSLGGGVGGGGLVSINQLQNEPNATGLINQYPDHTDPKYIGPGTWNVIHRRAIKATDHPSQILFIEFMKDICSGFPCTVCRDHCGKYIETHPMEEYINVTIEMPKPKNKNGKGTDGRGKGEESGGVSRSGDGVDVVSIGMFIWSWKFHNAVNARINKPIMSWDTAYNLYAGGDSLVCSKSCLETADFPPDGSENTTHKMGETGVRPVEGVGLLGEGLQSGNVGLSQHLPPRPSSGIGSTDLFISSNSKIPLVDLGAARFTPAKAIPARY